MKQATAEGYRATVEKALKHLGHHYKNAPTKLVIKTLAPFLQGPLPSTKAERRLALMAAAQLALQYGEGAQPKASKPVVAKTRKPKKDKFYTSWEWKRARYEALRIHGQRCQCCGWQPGDTDHGWLVVDHIQPRSKHPELQTDVQNLQVLCNDCNMGKSNVHADDFRGLEHWLRSMSRDAG